MEKEYVLQIAQTIKEQLVGMTPAPVIMSWGHGASRSLLPPSTGTCLHCASN